MKRPPRMYRSPALPACGEMFQSLSGPVRWCTRPLDHPGVHAWTDKTAVTTTLPPPAVIDSVASGAGIATGTGVPASQVRRSDGWRRESDRRLVSELRQTIALQEARLSLSCSEREAVLEGLLAEALSWDADAHRLGDLPDAPEFDVDVCISCGLDWPCWTARVRAELSPNTSPSRRDCDDPPPAA